MKFLVGFVLPLMVGFFLGAAQRWGPPHWWHRWRSFRKLIAVCLGPLIPPILLSSVLLSNEQLECLTRGLVFLSALHSGFFVWDVVDHW